MEFISKLYSNYFLNYFSSIDVPNALEEVRLSLSLDQKSELERNLTVQAFQTELLSLVLKQKEDQAIRYVLRAAVVLEDSSSLIKEDFFDFSTPLPQNSLAVGRSISHLSNLLNLKRLSSVIKYLNNN
ncbi:MAG: hypothetical protein KDK96_05625 [Chlamydiia bacterium]|nr:hypothetical protein [Chlamydiia bacterium]